MVVKSVVVVVIVTTFVTCSCRAVVMAVVTVRIPVTGVVTTHTTTAGFEPDRPAVTVELNVGAVGAAAVVEEDTNTVVFVTIR